MTGLSYLPSPPEAHKYRRWHWLRDEDGQLFLASWANRHGWHGGWSGKMDPCADDFEGWTYVGPVILPEATVHG